MKMFAYTYIIKKKKNKARDYKEWKKQSLMSEEKRNDAVYFRNPPDCI